MKKTVMVSTISPMARGEFLWTLPPDPIEITSTAMAAKTSRKKTIPGDPEDRLAKLVAQLEGRDLAEHPRQAARREAARVEK
jgi:hypothetical protein